MNIKIVSVCIGLIAVSGCRSVVINETPNGGPVTVNVNQSYAPDINLLSGIDTNTTKAIAQGAAMGLK